MKPQSREILSLFANNDYVPLYRIPPRIRNYTARINELRTWYGWDIPPPSIRKNHKGTMTSTYSMPAPERKRALKYLRGA